MSDSWTVLESVPEYETTWFTGGYDLVEQPDGSRKRYYWAALAPAVVVVAVHDGAVVFVEQYRPTVRETQLELPAGLVDEHDGEPIDPVAPEAYESAGARELREETGLAADEVTLLQEVAVATGLLRHRRGIVVAEGLTPTEQELDDNEFLEVRSVPVEEAIARAREPPTNEATVEGLLLAAADGYL